MYVVAVSGGVDSMALLDILVKHAADSEDNYKFVVAHLDHGIRQDSKLDRELVGHIARKHGLPFVYHEAQLGAGTSEDIARKVRYEFLHNVRQATGARAVITAHHHDDALETAVINLMRGTGRKGLSSLSSRATVHRPLLHASKQDLKQYAADQGLVWNEDSTNHDTTYTRNHVRHNILPKADEQSRAKLSDIVTRSRELNALIDAQLLHYLHLQPALDVLDRRQFIMLPHSVAREVMAAWLRKHGVRDFDSRTLERVVVGSKTLHQGKAIDVVKNHRIYVDRDTLALKRQDR